jgi:hypothetical protein
MMMMMMMMMIKGIPFTALDNCIYDNGLLGFAGVVLDRNLLTFQLHFTPKMEAARFSKQRARRSVFS